MVILRDKDIRHALINKLNNTYADDSHTLILQEFGLYEHRVRIDLAVVNGSMSGFEIKSDADTLERLPYQQEMYNKIFDNIIIVVGESHLEKIKSIVSDWWGIWVAQKNGDKVEFRIYREPSENHGIDIRALVRCLWKREVLEILKGKGLFEKKLANVRRSILWEMLVNSIPENELKQIILNYLKRRDDWHIVLPQESNGDLRQLKPILWDFQFDFQ